MRSGLFPSLTLLESLRSGEGQHTSTNGSRALLVHFGGGVYANVVPVRQLCASRARPNCRRLAPSTVSNAPRVRAVMLPSSVTNAPPVPSETPGASIFSRRICHKSTNMPFRMQIGKAATLEDAQLCSSLSPHARHSAGMLVTRPSWVIQMCLLQPVIRISRLSASTIS